MAGVLVLGEALEGVAAASTLEAIAAGRALGGPVAAAIIGDCAKSAAQDAIAHGADSAFVCEDGLGPEAAAAFAEQAAAVSAPRVVLGAKALLDGSVMARAAYRLGAGLLQDCASVALDADGRLTATRPVYGGNAMATFRASGSPAAASLRARAYEALERDDSRAGSIVPIEVDAAAHTRLRVVERVRRPQEGVRLEDARVVVGGGRGLGGPEAFAQLEELARLLRGAVGASRAACDAGWVPPSYQIGLTGRTVAPDLYLAVGISGASQHMAGCSGARDIVAINKDAGANIFKEARFGVVGDWRQVLPAFVDQLHELLSDR